MGVGVPRSGAPELARRRRALSVPELLRHFRRAGPPADRGHGPPRADRARRAAGRPSGGVRSEGSMRSAIRLSPAEFLCYVRENVISWIALSDFDDPTSFELVRVYFQEALLLDQLVEVALRSSRAEGSAAQANVSIDCGSGERSPRIPQEIEDQALPVLSGHSVRFSRGVIRSHGTDMFAVIHAYLLSNLLTCTFACKTISGRVCLSDEHGYHWVPNWAENRPGPAPARQPGDGHGTSMTNWNPVAGCQKAGGRTAHRTSTTAATAGVCA